MSGVKIKNSFLAILSLRCLLGIKSRSEQVAAKMYLDLIGQETQDIHISDISIKKVFKSWERMRSPGGR